MTIGQNIRALRKQRGLTQAQLGELCGVTGASIGSYEKGSTRPKRRVLDKLAQALDVSVDRLMVTDAPMPTAGNPVPLYDGVLSALKALYGAVEGRVILGENGTGKRYYVIQGAGGSFVLHEEDVAAIARTAQASVSPLVERLGQGA